MLRPRMMLSRSPELAQSGWADGQREADLQLQAKQGPRQQRCGSRMHLKQGLRSGRAGQAEACGSRVRQEVPKVPSTCNRFSYGCWRFGCHTGGVVPSAPRFFEVLLTSVPSSVITRMENFVPGLHRVPGADSALKNRRSQAYRVSPSAAEFSAFCSLLCCWVQCSRPFPTFFVGSEKIAYFGTSVC